MKSKKLGAGPVTRAAASVRFSVKFAPMCAAMMLCGASPAWSDTLILPISYVGQLIVSQHTDVTQIVRHVDDINSVVPVTGEGLFLNTAPTLFGTSTGTQALILPNFGPSVSVSGFAHAEPGGNGSFNSFAQFQYGMAILGPTERVNVGVAANLTVGAAAIGNPPEIVAFNTQSATASLDITRLDLFNVNPIGTVFASGTYHIGLDPPINAPFSADPDTTYTYGASNSLHINEFQEFTVGQIYLVTMFVEVFGGAINFGFGSGGVSLSATVDPTFTVPDGYTLLLSPGVGNGIGEAPLPAALPLFATGLGALGLLSWRRKRKAVAAAV